MNLRFRATTREDEADLIPFLAKAFSAPADAPFLKPELIRWKYWDVREDYRDPRSYVLESGGRIVAHAAIWPVVLRIPERTIRGAHMIDWARDPLVPGVGTILAKRLADLADFVYSIGGSVDARRVLPALGFKAVGSVWSAARPLKPLRHMLFHQHRDWRSPARLVRNAWWSLLPLHERSSGWTLRDADLTGSSEDVPVIGLDGSVSRPNSFFRYLKRCPSASVEVLQLEKDGHDQGRLAISVVSKQARIVGVWLRRPSPESLRTAYGLAEQASRKIGATFEITASGSTETKAAAVAAGLRVRYLKQVYLLNRRLRASETRFQFQAADNDASFLSDGQTEFLT